MLVRRAAFPSPKLAAVAARVPMHERALRATAPLVAGRRSFFKYRDLGVTAVHDCDVCTACDLNRYYSYRAEKGRTGRMLAFLALL